MPRPLRSHLVPILSIPLLALLPSCFNIEVTAPSGPVVVSERPVSAFSRISAEDGFVYVLEQGNTPGCRVETAGNLQDDILVSCEQNLLRIRRKNHVAFTGGSHVLVRITWQALHSVDVSGGSSVSCADTIRTQRFTHALSGGSRSTLHLATETCEVDLSGGSVLTLAGSTGGFTASSSGGSVLRASGFAARGCAMDISGGGTAELRVTDHLSVSASGGSHVRYLGDPRLDMVELSGGSTLQRAH